MQRATNEEIIQAYRGTGSVWKAAMKLGLCGQSVWERLNRLGIPLAGGHWTAEELEAAIQLANHGFSIGHIARQLGRTYAGIACKLGEQGVKHPYKPQPKIPRGMGLTKKAVVKIAKSLVESGARVSQAARQTNVSTTALVWAIQKNAPDVWQQYLDKYAKRPPATCEGCGQAFQPLNGRQVYCTAQCGYSARNDRGYFGGKRRTAIGLAEGVCQLCERKDKTHLAAHHVFGKANDPDNLVLIALCRGCHQLVGVLGVRKDTLQPEFWENLIALAVARGWADQGKKVAGVHVCVDINPLTEGELEEVNAANTDPLQMHQVRG